MQRLFQCKNCGHKFMADEASDFVCPECSSDNVTPVSGGNSKSLLLYGLGFLLCVGLGFGIGKLLKHPDESIPPQPDNNNVVENNTVNESNITSNETIVLSLTCTTPVHDDNWEYSFEASCNQQNKESLTFSLQKHSGETVAQNKDGKFSRIPANGSGYMCRVDAKDGRYAECPVSGFEPRPAQKVEQLSKEELQKLLDEKARELQNNSHPQINKKVSFTFVPAIEGTMNPDSFTGIISMIKRENWTNVKVTEVGYDLQTNKINKVVISREVKR